MREGSSVSPALYNTMLIVPGKASQTDTDVIFIWTLNITARYSEHKISESQARPDHVTKSPPGGRLSRYFKTLPGDFSASSLGGCSSTKLLQMFAIKFSELFILIVNYFLSLKLLHWLIKHQQSCSKYFSQRNQFYLVHQKFVYREKAHS